MPGQLSRLIIDVPVDADRFAKDLETLPPAAHQYAILYVSRSGSTWLADLLSRQGGLGKPREYLNLDMIGRFAAEVNANTLADYFAMLRRKRATANGVFGLKVGSAQLRLLTEEASVDEIFAGYAWIYLRRRNAVAQAVSLYKARLSGNYQRRRNDPPDLRQRLADADARIPYDAAAIGRWMEEIVAMEQAAERMIASARLAPVRLLYEDIMATDPAALADLVHRLLFGAGAPQQSTQPSNIEQSGSARNLEFENRFRHERADLARRLEQQRPPLSG